MTELLFLAIALTGVSGIAGLLPSAGRSGRLSAALMVLGSAFGVAAAGETFVGRGAATGVWSLPSGTLRLDALAGVFLVQIFVVAPLGAVYGLSYWSEQEHPGQARQVRLFYGLITAAMALVVVASNALLFLVAWEVMALTGFVLIATEHERREVRQSGFVYLVATRVGTLCLFAFFALLRSVNGSYAFTAPRLDPGAPVASAMMILALLGFGLKAGAMPLHLWLPGAHANAPTHVSALMSGVLIKMGIYGLLRFISFFPTPPSWWGAALLGIGAISGVLGVVFAIAQHDIKRLLAYHSVENVGIILMGAGVGLIGRTFSNQAVFVLGMGGALLHIWNHGLFKALLFLSAGSVIHSTRTRDIDRLGGVAKQMPWTTLAFVLGAVAISGLPPLNGFVSEFFVYLAALFGARTPNTLLFGASAFVVPVLALVGALALACFVKVVGTVFLGQARGPQAAAAHESSPAMLVPMGILSVACIVIGLGPTLVAPVLDRVLGIWTAPPRSLEIAQAAPLESLSVAGAILTLAIAVGVAWARRATNGSVATGTWDCGYAAPSPTMQYTASSFASAIVNSVGGVFGLERRRPDVSGAFPCRSSFESHLPDPVLDRAVLPAMRSFGRGLMWFRWMQRGAVQLYLLYVLVALVLLLLLQR